MRPSFAPRLVSESPFADPALFVPFALERRALLFDAGDVGPLSPKDILKISHVFVSHAHMDHFMGFDRLLLLCLGRDKLLHVFGPAGIIKNIEGKLAGYLWNLVHRFTNSFSIIATEVTENSLTSCMFNLADAFAPSPLPQTGLFEGVLLSEPSFTVSAEILDHGTPCLGFALRERFHINILTDGLLRLGLKTGSWLSRLKEALYDGSNLETPVVALLEDGAEKEFALGFLAESIVLTSPGQSFAYVTDAVFSPENERRILRLANGADHLYIEAAFLDKDCYSAAQKYHLTAGQAGRLAKKAGVRRLSVFHFSPRYACSPQMLKNEALEAFSGPCEARENISGM